MPVGRQALDAMQNEPALSRSPKAAELMDGRSGRKSL